MNSIRKNTKLLKHSKNVWGDEIFTFDVTFPRIILSELNTHREFSKNTSSSRAIPFSKMVEAVQNNPFIPFAWQKHHKGMQGTEYFTKEEEKGAKLEWVDALDQAIKYSKHIYEVGVTKQLANRLLEPFMWVRMIVTTSRPGLDNFFELRCPRYELLSEGMPMHFHTRKGFLDYVNSVEGEEFKGIYDDLTDLEWRTINSSQAEIHIQELAEAMYDLVVDSEPEELLPGYWHIPQIVEYSKEELENVINYDEKFNGIPLLAKLATVDAARFSYTTIEGQSEMNIKRKLEIWEDLVTADPMHSSPLEHCGRAMGWKEHESYIRGIIEYEDYDDMVDLGEREIVEPLYKYKGWSRNIKGFVQLREIVESKRKFY